MTNFVDLPADSDLGLLLQRLAEPISLAVHDGLRRWRLRDLVVMVATEDDDEPFSVMAIPKADALKAWGPTAKKEPFKTMCERIAGLTLDPDKSVWVAIVSPTIQATASVQLVPIDGEGRA